MRELKFRAWDKDRKEYLSGGAVFIEVLRGSNPEQGRLYLDTSEHKCGDRFVLQQFTGLKDKNGVEIYEGDIVKIHAVRLENPPFGEVTFKNGSFYIGDRWILGSFNMQCAEVIGNIYQNPELLK